MKQPNIAKLPFGIEYRRLIPPSQPKPRRYGKHWTTWNWFKSACQRDQVLAELVAREKAHEFRPVMRRSEENARQRIEQRAR